MKPEDFLEKGDEDETTYEQAVKDIEADKVKKQALVDQKKAKDEELDIEIIQHSVREQLN